MQAKARTTVLIAGATTVAVAATATFAIAATNISADDNPSPATPEISAGEVGIPTPDGQDSQSREAGAGAVESTAAAIRPSRLRRTFNLTTQQKVFFITIDDGITKNAKALAFVRKYKLPVTVFLTKSAIDGRADYFRKITAFGGTVENHTMTHKSLPSTSAETLASEVCGPQGRYQRLFGHAPTMLRPPYGNGGYSRQNSSERLRIDHAAVKCGLRHMVMWDAVAENGSFQFIKGSLHRGDIVLFHFTPHLYIELKRVMAMANAKGLRPAPLQNYLR